MQKTAQKRSLLNKLREVTNVSGIAAEKFFNPEFTQVMDELRKTDDSVRAIVTGEKIGDVDPPDDAVSLKDLLKSAKSNLNRREYMKAVSDLGRFHKKMYDIINVLSSFKGNVDKVHEKFLFQGLDDDVKKYLHDLKSRVVTTSLNVNPYFIRQANILDFFANIGTERGRALAIWEKKYPKRVKEMKDGSAKLLQNSEKLLSTVLSSLKNLASARATRNPDKYLSGMDDIIKKYNGYDTEFREYYKKNVKDFLEKQELMAPAKTDTSSTPAELGKQEVSPVATPGASPGVAPTMTDLPALVHQTEKSLEPVIPDLETTIPLAPAPLPSTPPPAPQPGLQKIPLLPPIPSLPPQPDTSKDARPPAMSPIPNTGTLISGVKPEVPKVVAPAQAQHRRFMESLETMSNENPILLMAHIRKYAQSIQSSDPETAIQLFKLARSIKG